MLEEPPDDLISMRGLQRVFKTQLAVCLWIGISSFLLFCVLRYRWPHIYAVRTLRHTTRSSIRPLPKRLFAWISVVYSISEEEVLENSGLDAYVFLSFFRMGVLIFFQLSILAIGILSPIRYYFTGNYDKDGIIMTTGTPEDPPTFDVDFPTYFWVYPIFTYVFSIIVYINIFNMTKKVLKTRQKYLASQNSITDRTIKLEGIPKRLLNKPEVLKDFIQDLGIGKVTGVKFIYDWTSLEKLFEEREKIIKKLEELYSSIYMFKIDIYSYNKIPAVLPDGLKNIKNKNRYEKIKHDISELSKRLLQVNGTIKAIQEQFDPTSNMAEQNPNSYFRQVESAFITMDSVASAQMAAQTVLDPRVHKLIVSLAPAPKDVNWKSFKLSSYQKVAKSYMVTFIIVLSYLFIILAITPLTTLLDLKTIKKFYPSLGEYIGSNKWLATFVTGILPPMLFSLFNVLLPYFYRYLSKCQGYSSNSDEELSTLLKNFFFIFFNLFLVFIVTGTFWDYISYISDTTKIAFQLARSLKKLSLFYVDLILLQGLAMFPVRLLQIDDFVKLNLVARLFFIKDIFLKSPRDYRFHYYTSQIFDFGLQLPQHILIFIIILIYSVVSTKIVVSGLAYFVLGYFVYKYQLTYNFVHPPHSTGKVWPMVFRRLMLGLIIFQLFMCGTLALEGAIALAILCSPLCVVTLIITYNYEKYYLPLSSFIALRAIQSPNDFDREFDDDSLLVISNSLEVEADDSFINESSQLLSSSPILTTSGLSRRRSTLDEDREQFTDYTYPYLVDPLYGPCIGFEGDFISIVDFKEHSLCFDAAFDDNIEPFSPNGNQYVIRRKLTVAEWE